jgi:protein-disulfide isomerase
MPDAKKEVKRHAEIQRNSSGGRRKTLPVVAGTITFKVDYFYAALVVIAFVVGFLCGCVVGIEKSSPANMQSIAQDAVPSKTILYDIETKGFPSLGVSDAPVVIVEFGDFQCPVCYRWHVETFKPLLRAYPGKIRFVYRNYPLDFHQNAFGAAEAALCAGDQDAYWQYSDALFDNQTLLNNEDGRVLESAEYATIAEGLRLDVVDFSACMTSRKYKRFIEDDMAYADGLPMASVGDPAIGGTPTFFINGIRVVGAYSLDYF